MIITDEGIVTEVDISHIITEDNVPVDNIFSERQQRLLANILYTSWKPRNAAPFVALTNVGLFYGIHASPVVPDLLLSLNVQLPPEVWQKRHRSYFVWEYGKPPDLVIEIVSNLKGGELDEKLGLYATIGIKYYVVFDPSYQYGSTLLRSYKVDGGHYEEMPHHSYPDLGLGLEIWQGEYEGLMAEWLRWKESGGELLPLPGERIIHEQIRAEQAESRAEQAESRAEILAAKLREMGFNPESLIP